MDKCCGTCMYWQDDRESGRKGQGTCRYNPPVSSNTMSQWPPTYQTDWCGKWAVRVAPLEDAHVRPS